MGFFKNNPKVSIVIVCYNYEKYIEIAINSIKKQNYKNWELIIVNDNSQDSTKKILDKYKSKKIKIINLKKNIGSYKATNLAFKNLKGKYVAILDADDYSHPKRISSQVLELEKDPKIGLVITNYKLIDEYNNFIKDTRFVSKKIFDKRFPCENLACNSSAMFRQQFIKELKFYSNSFFYMYDYFFYLKIFKISNIKLINIADGDGKELLLNFKRWIENDLPTFIRKDETDLINIRDEILGDINKTLYLFTLD